MPISQPVALAGSSVRRSLPLWFSWREQSILVNRTVRSGLFQRGEVYGIASSKDRL